jgi:TrmH family RNA methyltransferase
VARISSPSNPQIRHIRALRQRKAREASGRFFVEGIRIVAEALQLGAPVEALVVAPALLTSDFARGLATSQRQAGTPLLEVTPEIFGTLSARERPQGLGAVLRQRWERLEDVAPGDGLWVALSEIADPGNLGTILRTCDAVGAAGVVLLGHTADPYDPEAVRASMGALFAQRLIRAQFADFAAWARRHGVFVVGAAGSAPTDYQALRYSRPLVLLMGSERQGLAPEHQALCDALVAIPMVGRSDSLNVAVATAVILYEIFNQGRTVQRHAR